MHTDDDNHSQKALIEIPYDNEENFILNEINYGNSMKEKLIDAIKTGDANTVSECLEQDPNIIYDGDVLEETIYTKVHDDITQMILGLIPKDKIDTTLAPSLYGPLLSVACRYKNTYAAKLLINNGADINKPDSVGTPLFYACLRGLNEVVEILLNKGANINEKSSDGSTPLMIACEMNREKTVEILLNNKASVNIEDNYGNTTLMYAGNDKIFQKLLKEDFTTENVNKAFNKLSVARLYHDWSPIIELLVNDPRSLDAIKDGNLENLINEATNNATKSILLNLQNNIEKTNSLLLEYKNNPNLINEQIDRLIVKLQENREHPQEFEEERKFRDKVQAYLDLPPYIKEELYTKWKMTKQEIENLDIQIGKYNISLAPNLKATSKVFSDLEGSNEAANNMLKRTSYKEAIAAALGSFLYTPGKKQTAKYEASMEGVLMEKEDARSRNLIQNLPQNTHESNESKGK